MVFFFLWVRGTLVTAQQHGGGGLHQSTPTLIKVYKTFKLGLLNLLTNQSHLEKNYLQLMAIFFFF